MFRYTTIPTLAEHLNPGDEKDKKPAITVPDRIEILEKGKMDRLQRFQKRQGYI